MTDEANSKTWCDAVDIESINDFLNEFRAETDRAAVIVGAAKLDYLLFCVLDKFLVPNPSSRDELLDADAPLGSFSARIHASYRLGLIDNDFAKALHLVRKMRNSFAHESTRASLNEGSHRDRVRELCAAFLPYDQYELHKLLSFPEKTGARADFFAVLAVMAVRLHSLFKLMKPLMANLASTSCTRVRLVPESYSEPMPESQAQKLSELRKNQVPMVKK